MGYNTTSIPAGDLARLEEALDNVPDSFWYSKIVEQIERCDEAEKRTDMTGTMNNSTVPRGRVESIAGDVDRTIATTDFKETLKTWTQIYMYETDRLALHLYVPNYRNPEQARYRFNREGAEFIQIRGVVRARDVQPDNTVSSMRMAQAQISYRGTGNLAESTQPGWITQLLFKYWPL